jgi:uncharacterized protein YkwD
MRPVLPRVLSALALLSFVACVDPDALPDEEGVLVGPSTHDPAEAAANDGADGVHVQALQAEPTVLTNGTAITGLSGARNAIQTFRIDVPANATNLVFKLSGGTGDADLYVKLGTPPTQQSYDIRPYLNGNDESGSVPTPMTGTYFVMLHAYRAYSGASLVASFVPDGTPPTDPPTTGPDCTNATTWPADWVAFEDEVLALVNQRRAAGATCGGVVKPPVPALVMDAKLRQAARCHSLDMAQNNYFSHDSQDGRSPWDRIREAAYTGFGNGENIAAGQGTPASVMASWMSSTGHCNNIMTSGSNEIGVGYGFDASADYDRYWTQTFGKR